MQAIQKSANTSTLQIVWRNRFPLRLEKRAGVLVLVSKKQRFASRNWASGLVTLFGLTVLCKALWHVRSLP